MPKIIRSFAIFSYQCSVDSYQLPKVRIIHFQNSTFAPMITIPHKAKHFLVFSVKLLIVVGAFYFIYYKLSHDSNLNLEVFKNKIIEISTITGVFFILLLSFLNRFFEILKWQNLVTFIRPISIGEATKQVLGALTAGIFTPNNLGEYAGKALFFETSKTKTVIFLNLICNGIQMILSVVFGIIGLFIIGYWKWALIAIFIGLVVIAFGFITNKVTLKGYSLHKMIKKINEIPKSIHQKNIVLALCRYLFFSHQYYFLFKAFGVNLPYLLLLGTIAVVYFLASSLPSFQFMDFAVKGSVALFFFEKHGVNNLTVVFISTIMWLLNIVIPVIIGSYYVLKFKPKWE
jgi:hypothetical protein